MNAVVKFPVDSATLRLRTGPARFAQNDGVGVFRAE